MKLAQQRAVASSEFPGWLNGGNPAIVVLFENPQIKETFSRLDKIGRSRCLAGCRRQFHCFFLMGEIEVGHVGQG